MKEIITDKKTGRTAQVLFELTKRNIADIKDEYILKQLGTAINAPWDASMPDSIQKAINDMVTESLESQYVLGNMNPDAEWIVQDVITDAVRKIESTRGAGSDIWVDAYRDAGVLDHAYQVIYDKYQDEAGSLLDSIETPENCTFISGCKWSREISDLSLEWVDEIKPFLLLVDQTGTISISDILEKQTNPVFAVKNEFVEKFRTLADSDGMVNGACWAAMCVTEAKRHGAIVDWRKAVRNAFGFEEPNDNDSGSSREIQNLTVKGETARIGSDKLAEEIMKQNEVLRDG